MIILTASELPKKGKVIIMRILGIDPGYAIVGWGIIDYTAGKFSVVEYGAITTEAGTPMPERLQEVFHGLEYVIEKHNPVAISVEQLFFTTNQKTAISVAQARGVIILAAQLHHLTIHEYTPLQVKQSVVGYGKAEKRQVMDMTKRILNLSSLPKPDDVADALAVAICHAHSSGSLLGGMNALEKALLKEKKNNNRFSIK